MTNKKLYEDKECKEIAKVIAGKCWGGVIIEKDKFYSELYEKFSKEKVDAVMKDLYGRDLMEEYIGPAPIKSATIYVHDDKDTSLKGYWRIYMYLDENTKITERMDMIQGITTTTNLSWNLRMKEYFERIVYGKILDDFLDDVCVLESGSYKKYDQKSLEIVKELPKKITEYLDLIGIKPVNVVYDIHEEKNILKISKRLGIFLFLDQIDVGYFKPHLTELSQYSFHKIKNENNEFFVKIFEGPDIEILVSNEKLRDQVVEKLKEIVNDFIPNINIDKTYEVKEK